MRLDGVFPAPPSYLRLRFQHCPGRAALAFIDGVPSIAAAYRGTGLKTRATSERRNSTTIRRYTPGSAKKTGSSCYSDGNELLGGTFVQSVGMGASASDASAGRNHKFRPGGKSRHIEHIRCQKIFLNCSSSKTATSSAFRRSDRFSSISPRSTGEKPSNKRAATSSFGSWFIGRAPPG